MNTLVISSVVTAVSPISITQPGDRNKNKAPVVMVSGNKHACIPGSSLRGMLRRQARAELHEKLSQKSGGDLAWDLREFYWHTIGGVRLSKDDAGNDFKSISEVVPFTLVENIRARDPLMSLFGSFDPCTITSRIQVGNAVCNEPIVVKSMNGETTVNLDKQPSVRSDDLQRSPDVASILSPKALEEWAAITVGTRAAASIRREIEELERAAREARRAGRDTTSIYAEITKLGKERDSLIKSSEGSSVSIQQLVDASELIPAGSMLNQRIRLVNASDVEIGLLLASLKRYANDCMVGGKRNTGNGEIKLDWSIRDVNAGGTVARIQVSLDDGFVIADGEDYVNEKIGAWNAFAASDALQTHYPTTAEMKVAV